MVPKNMRLFAVPETRISSPPGRWSAYGMGRPVLPFVESKMYDLKWKASAGIGDVELKPGATVTLNDVVFRDGTRAVMEVTPDSNMGKVQVCTTPQVSRWARFRAKMRGITFPMVESMAVPPA